MTLPPMARGARPAGGEDDAHARAAEARHRGLVARAHGAVYVAEGAWPRAVGSSGRRSRAEKVLGWPRRRKLAHPFLWEYSYKRLKLAQLLGQLVAFLTQ
jgi:hypothetical protein